MILEILRTPLSPRSPIVTNSLPSGATTMREPKCCRFPAFLVHRNEHRDIFKCCTFLVANKFGACQCRSGSTFARLRIGEIDFAACGEVGCKRDIEQAALTLDGDLGNVGDWFRNFAIVDDAHVADAFGHEECAIGQERQGSTDG